MSKERHPKEKPTQIDNPPAITPPSVFEDPYMGIEPTFTYHRGHPSLPNSGPEHNPVLERKFPWEETGNAD